MLKLIVTLLMLVALAIQIAAGYKYYINGADYELASHYYLLVIILLWIASIVRNFID